MRYSRIRLILLLTILIPAGICLGAVWWAGRQLAFPARRVLQDYHRETLANPELHGLLIRKFTLEDGTPCLLCEPDPTGKLGERGEKMRAQMSKRGARLASWGSVVGTVVLIHGRLGRKEDYLPIAERFCSVGLRCLLADMPAHGDHPDKLAFYGTHESKLPEQILTHAADKFSFDPSPAGMMGISMGGSIALHSAAEPTPRWNALCIVSSFDTLASAVENNAVNKVGGLFGRTWVAMSGPIYRLYSGQSLEDVSPVNVCPKLRMPTLIAHGTNDGVVPIESGRKLFEALPSHVEKRWVEIPNATHDNVLITEFPIYATLAEWLLRHNQAPPE